MNQTLESLNRRDLDKLAVKRLTLFTIIAELVYIVLYCLVLNPLYTHLDADVITMNAWYTGAVGILCDLLDPILFIIIYPTTVYALWRGGSAGLRVPAVFSGMTLFKFIFNYFMGRVFAAGAFPNMEDVWDELSNGMALNLLLMFLLEMLQYWLIIVLFMLHRSAADRRRSRMEADAALNGRTDAETASDMPMTRLFAFGNPVQRTLLDAGIVVFLGGAVNHLIYQMALINYADRADSPAQVAADLLGDLLLGVLVYLAGILLCNRHHRKY